MEVDDQPLVQFIGMPSRLTFDDRFFVKPKANQLMLGGWESEFRVSRWELTPISFATTDLARAKTKAPNVLPDVGARKPPVRPEDLVANTPSNKQSWPLQPTPGSATHVTPSPEASDMRAVPIW